MTFDGMGETPARIQQDIFQLFVVCNCNNNKNHLL